MKESLTPSQYHSYINSQEWRAKHKDWLRACHNRCSMFPWMRIGRYKSKYYRYSIHHTGIGYTNLGNEKLVSDVLPLCPFAHWLIHGGRMKVKAPWQPNLGQKILHFWCGLRLKNKQIVVCALIGLVVFYIFGN
ncbi:hypothetical protein [Nodularia sp. UHCC 0506]|uniref:hypothetical protein n=1 Tax=Nodularia sp. UHCC 0506 TaxID=3110243 RepID=UPI002B1FE045|nr:hypothetical protein [Nodularia sp. UHCC 0506]MEA5516951.1 hypothetical protein [Nodularia sp. UHCC 0506]